MQGKSWRYLALLVLVISSQWSVVSSQDAFDCSGICAYAFFSEEGGR